MVLGAFRAEALEGGFVGTGQDPGFVGDARSVGAEGEEISAGFEHAQVLLRFLGDDVAENATLFLHEIFASGAQLVKHAAGNKRGRGELGVGMFELLPGAGTVILEDADVLEAPSRLRS